MTLLLITKSFFFDTFQETRFCPSPPEFTFQIIFNLANYIPIVGVSIPNNYTPLPHVLTLAPVQFCYPLFYYMN